MQYAGDSNERYAALVELKKAMDAVDAAAGIYAKLLAVTNDLYDIINGIGDVKLPENADAATVKAASAFLEEAKAAYEKSRQKYASFADANSEVVLMSYQSKLEDLENDMQLKFNNYSQTAQQVQKAQAKIQENTPAFTVIQNATVPLKSSSMPRTLMVIIFVFVGVIADALWVLVLSQAFGKKK